MLAKPRVKPTAPRETVGDAQPSFVGGLNTVSNDFSMRQDSMRRSDNVRLTEYGAVTKRGGIQRTQTTAFAAAPVRGGFGWRFSPTVFQTLATCNGHLFTTVYSGSFPLTWTDQGTGLAAGLTAFSPGASPSFAAFNDGTQNVVYIATGTTLYKWNGATVAACNNAVQAAGVAVYHDRLWGWGVTGSLDSIFYSELSGATASTGGDSLGNAAFGGGQIIVRTFGQQSIVAAAPINTSLLIWHQRGISRITGYGNSDITVSPEAITADVGLVGQGALAVYDNIAYFVSERGVYKANEMQVVPLGTPDKPDPVAPVLLTLDASELVLVKCTYNRATRELWVQLPGVGIFIYQTIVQSWSGPFMDGYIAPADTTSLFETLDAANQPVMLRGDATGFVSLCDAPIVKDNVLANGTGGSVFSAVIQTHRMYCGDPTQANGYRWIRMLASLLGSTSVNVAWNTLTAADSYQISSAAGGFAWGSGTWGSGTWGVGGQAPLYIPCSGTGPFMDVTITDSGEALAQYASIQIEGFIYGER